MQVVTVAGPIDPSPIGAVLTHEHLLGAFAAPVGDEARWRADRRAAPRTPEEVRLFAAPLTLPIIGEVSLGGANSDNETLTDETLARTELQRFVDTGGRMVVEVTSGGLGRDPEALRRLSLVTGLHIVMGCGWYHPAWEPSIAGRSAASLRDEIVRELTAGTDGAEGIRAGVIGELAVLDAHVPAERALLCAAAQACAATGAPIILDLGDDGRQDTTMTLLLEEGAAPDRIVASGCDRYAADPERLLPLLERGATVQFSRLGRLATPRADHDDLDVAQAVIWLAQRGFGERILLSHDIRSKEALTAFGGGGYGFLGEQFLPLLRREGVTEELIETITVRTPLRVLSWEVER